MKPIHGIRIDHREPVHDFLGELGTPDLQDFVARFQKLSTNALWVRMGEWFKPMEYASNVWQVSSSNFRILGFRFRNVLILTNSFRKNKSEAQKKEIAECERLQRLFKQDNQG